MVWHILTEPEHLSILALGITIGLAIGFALGLVVWMVCEFLLVPPLARWIAEHEELGDDRRR